MKNALLIVLGFMCFSAIAQNAIADKPGKKDFPIVSSSATPVVFDVKDDSLVSIAATLFSDDVERVTGKRPVLKNTIGTHKDIIIIGTLEKSGFIQELVKAKKLDINALKGQWDGYRIQVIDKPFKGINRALVIAGANKRGAAYGILELSAQMGVSPWYWWGDVPTVKKSEVYVKKDIVLADAPKVKYRGIFINDEAPALSGWVADNFGNFDHRFYEKVFELLLRLKGNYLWPAMWGRAFNDDDPQKISQVVADKWGIVMGTSHHEPMLRAQAEWKRYGTGAWDYTKNKAVLKGFWKKGIENMGTHESIVTIGMRGDGDEPMTEGTATALLEQIVADQRQIIEDVTGKPAAETPQVWALYKEVQDYYDKGMRVPDDVTLLLCDDNWGNIRKLPKVGEKPRKGGYGIYYHFDYVGGPRNYKWINTNNIARVYEQMHLAWEYNARQIWIVNVGDIKPMEFPISFFLDYAWNPEKWTPDNLRDYYTQWARDQFGEEFSGEIGYILRKYGQMSAMRKPELVDAKSYSSDHYNEAQNVVDEYKQLLEKAEEINQKLPQNYRDAYYQLVLHPVKANTNLHQMYLAAALNHKYAAFGNPKANAYADQVKALFEKDSLISVEYNKELSNGKWNHFMDQVHIGYTSWNDPRHDIMPKVMYVDANTIAQPVPEVLTDGKSTEGEARKAAGKTTVFYEKDGYVSIHAENYSRAINTNGVAWKVIPDMGRTSSGITPFPVTAPAQQPGGNSPHLEFDFYTYDKGIPTVQVYFSPTLNFSNSIEGLRYAVSINDGQPQVVGINPESSSGIWNAWVANNIIIKSTKHEVLQPGRHTLKIWMVDPAVVLQKIVIDFGGVKPSYLGPPETKVQK
jgi:Glycosyl hydrolase family 115/Gylcosyl hydrolase family 115 C-terminal domain